MGKRSKKPAPWRRRHSPARNVSTPLVLDGKDPDNPTFKFLLVVPGNIPMSLCFPSTLVEPNMFKVGTSDENTNTFVKQTIYDMVIDTIRLAIPIEKETIEAFESLVEAAYCPNAINDYSFSFGYPGGTTRFNFAAVTKYVFRPDDDATEKTIVCFMPPAFVENISLIVSSALLKKPSDDAIQPISPFLSPPMKAAYDSHRELKSKGLSPYKSFVDSLSMDSYGNWNSSITVYTALAASSDPPGSQLGTPPNAPTGQDNGPSSSPPVQTNQEPSALQNSASTMENPVEVTHESEGSTRPAPLPSQNSPATVEGPVQVSDYTEPSDVSNVPTTTTHESPPDLLSTPNPTSVDRTVPTTRPTTGSSNPHLAALRARMRESELNVRNIVDGERLRNAFLSMSEAVNSFLEASDDTTSPNDQRLDNPLPSPQRVAPSYAQAAAQAHDQAQGSTCVSYAQAAVEAYAREQIANRSSRVPNPTQTTTQPRALDPTQTATQTEAQAPAHGAVRERGRSTSPDTRRSRAPW